MTARLLEQPEPMSQCPRAQRQPHSGGLSHHLYHECNSHLSHFTQQGDIRSHGSGLRWHFLSSLLPPCPHPLFPHHKGLRGEATSPCFQTFFLFFFWRPCIRDTGLKLVGQRKTFIDPKKLFTVYMKFKFNWLSLCILSSNLIYKI